MVRDAGSLRPAELKTENLHVAVADSSSSLVVVSRSHDVRLGSGVLLKLKLLT